MRFFLYTIRHSQRITGGEVYNTVYETGIRYAYRKTIIFEKEKKSEIPQTVLHFKLQNYARTTL